MNFQLVSKYERLCTEYNKMLEYPNLSRQVKEKKLYNTWETGRPTEKENGISCTSSLKSIDRSNYFKPS